MGHGPDLPKLLEQARPVQVGHLVRGPASPDGVAREVEHLGELEAAVVLVALEDHPEGRLQNETER